MSVFRTKYLKGVVLTGLLFACPAVPILAQSVIETPAAGRDASFVDPDQSPPSAPAENAVFSGLATEPPVPIAPPPVAQQVPVAAASVAVSSDAKLPDIIAPPVAVATLPDVSAEAIGTQNADNLSADMWKGTPRIVADSLLSIAAPTSSPVLNNLAKRLMATAAAPPDGTDETSPGLTSLRVQKLVAFGDGADAWALAKNADAKLIGDDAYQNVVENRLALNGEDVCPLIPELTKTRSSADWQRATIICQLRAKDIKAAQVGMDVMRATRPHDSIFLEVTDKNVIGTEKNLPFQLTPLSATTLALLRMTDKGLPGELYGRPDWSLVPALLHTAPKQDVAQLGMAEHAVERGMIDVAELETLYRNTVFKPEELSSPIMAHESGLRERALYFRAAESEKDPNTRIGYALRFIQSATPAFLNGAGAVAADMVGAVKPQPAMQENAAAVMWIDMLANRGEAALEWLHLAQTSTVNSELLIKLWPQLVLAGLETQSDYDVDLDKWLAAALAPVSAQDDPRIAREAAATSLLLLDAAGFKIPDEVWVKVFAAPHNEKHVAFSPTLFDRLQAAGSGKRNAETILLTTDLAGDGAISLPAAVAITRALREVGFKSEAALFARHTIALSMKQN